MPELSSPVSDQSCSSPATYVDPTTMKKCTETRDDHVLQRMFARKKGADHIAGEADDLWHRQQISRRQ